MALFIFIIYIGYSTYKSSDYPSHPSHVINAIDFIFIRVGLTYSVLSLQDTWLKTMRWIKRRESSRVDEMDTRSIGSDQRTCLKIRVIAVHISRDQTHPKHQIAIQRMRFHAFYNAYTSSFIRSVHSRSEGQNLIIMVRHYVFHLNR